MAANMASKMAAIALKIMQLLIHSKKLSNIMLDFYIFRPDKTVEMDAMPVRALVFLEIQDGCQNGSQDGHHCLKNRVTFESFQII